MSAAEIISELPKLTEAERRAELRQARIRGQNGGFYNTPATNSFAPQGRDDGFFNPPPPYTNSYVPPNP